jgi:hypothetical protein
VNVAYPKKDDDEGEGGENGVSERECYDGGSRKESGGWMTGRNVQSISVGQFKAKTHESNYC